ncbi:MAG: marR [Cyanobacteria bacterium RYN_339]|nr:marR [Cyanobacteria bacterium RYN_339]
MTPHQPIPQDVSLLPVLRQLTDCYLQVERTSTRQIEATGLTHPQFDIVVTLGDTPGMSCKDLGEQTFITKGTLTSVLDRLEGKGLVVRSRGTQDTRQIFCALTPAGQALYERIFLPFVESIRPRIGVLSDVEQDQLIALLQKLKSGFAGS